MTRHRRRVVDLQLLGDLLLRKHALVALRPWPRGKAPVAVRELVRRPAFGERQQNKDESSPGAPGNSRAVDVYATMQTRGRSFAHQTPQIFCRNLGALRGRSQCAEATFKTVIASKAVVVDPTFLPNHFLPLIIQGQIVVAAGLAGSFSLSLYCQQCYPAP